MISRSWSSSAGGPVEVVGGEQEQGDDLDARPPGSSPAGRRSSPRPRGARRWGRPARPRGPTGGCRRGSPRCAAAARSSHHDGAAAARRASRRPGADRPGGSRRPTLAGAPSPAADPVTSRRPDAGDGTATAPRAPSHGPGRTGSGPTLGAVTRHRPRHRPGPGQAAPAGLAAPVVVRGRDRGRDRAGDPGRRHRLGGGRRRGRRLLADGVRRVRHQRALPPPDVAHGRARTDAHEAPRPRDDLRLHRGHLHAVRRARPARAHRADRAGRRVGRARWAASCSRSRGRTPRGGSGCRSTWPWAGSRSS